MVAPMHSLVTCHVQNTSTSMFTVLQGAALEKGLVKARAQVSACALPVVVLPLLLCALP